MTRDLIAVPMARPVRDYFEYVFYLFIGDLGSSGESSYEAFFSGRKW